MRSVDNNCLETIIQFPVLIFPIATKYCHIFGIKDIWKENPPKSNLHVVKIEVITLNCIISDTYLIEISVERWRT
ncbi:hypothetical protein GLOIN_2v1789683 [Rhizophagus irregularis DAOM 181602=DAOM 197198]|nr:hypothetical protein GLOIN_2v1789683 [Rhizophagus irregularis DAOM 181602=DAOM 197198]